MISIFILSSCATSFLKFDKPEQLKKNDEFDEKVKIVESAPSQPTPLNAAVVLDQKNAEPAAVVPSLASKIGEAENKKIAKIESEKNKKEVKEKKTKELSGGKKKVADKKTAVSAPLTNVRRQPEIEDDAGFSGRRPLIDPFRVGEEIVHDVNYFKVSAGELRFKVSPFVNVNDRKAYAFKLAIKTSNLFSSFYSVDDSVDIFMDYESLVPSVFQLHVTESRQLREAKMLFNEKDNTATFWEKKVTQKDGVEEKKQNWEILPFSQNVYSAIFYMRFFRWEVGKEYAFHVANDKDNLVFSGKALRKEILETKLGPMKSIVISPNIVLKGKFQPIGENLIWLSDDEHRYILRIEAKIKIGTLVSEVSEIH
jgi:hypothetical protein